MFIISAALLVQTEGISAQNKTKAQAPCECEFMIVAVFPQLLANKALTKDDLVALFTGAKRIIVTKSDGTQLPLVNPETFAIIDRELLADFILKYMGVEGIRLVFGNLPENQQRQLIGYLGKIIAADASIHYVAYNGKKEKLWDYHSIKRTETPVEYIPVWLVTASA